MRRNWPIRTAVVLAVLSLILGLSGELGTGTAPTTRPHRYRPTPEPVSLTARYQAAASVAERFTVAYLSYNTRSQTAGQVVARVARYARGRAIAQVRREYSPRPWDRAKSVDQRARATAPEAGGGPFGVGPRPGVGAPSAEIIQDISVEVDSEWNGGGWSGTVTLAMSVTCHRLSCSVAHLLPHPKPRAQVSAPGQPATVAVYRDPMRGIRGLHRLRIDEGVDYAGSGPLYALGTGTIVRVRSAGWPGGVFIDERLGDGPAKGRYVYEAEAIQPAVHVGQRVNANTVLGRLQDQYPDMEIGWGAPGGAPEAAAHAVWYEEGSTAYGENFSQLLVRLGAPPGVYQGFTVGRLPARWPRW